MYLIVVFMPPMIAAMKSGVVAADAHATLLLAAILLSPSARGDRAPGALLQTPTTTSANADTCHGVSATELVA
jgi:hypothetical protein